jgi:hypothetical protein
VAVVELMVDCQPEREEADVQNLVASQGEEDLGMDGFERCFPVASHHDPYAYLGCCHSVVVLLVMLVTRTAGV